MFRTLALAAAAALAASACGVDPSVTAQRADRIAPGIDAPVFEPGPGTDPPASTAPTGAPSTSAAEPPIGATADPQDAEPPATTPPDTDPPQTAPTIEPPPFDPAAIDFGPAKPPQPYDQFLLTTINDIEAWWTAQFPVVYGGTFEPLAGRVIAAYPGRPDDIPGCGTPRTTYDEVREFAAFYCAVGDFIVYDDADGGLLADLADRFGPATIAIVLAHEYGHAIQFRIGALERSLPTVTTEQQADCFAGAWSARAAGGIANGLQFTDADVRAGLISMLEVRDPVGLNQLSAGGHGSGFDRVGAFQVGFLDGPGRCAQLLDDPLPLSPGDYLSVEDSVRGGNAPWGYDDQQLFQMLPTDLNLYWDADVAATAATFDPLSLVAVQSAAETGCDRLGPLFEFGAALCLDDDQDQRVMINEPAAFELYRQELYGDFSVGYLLGVAWAEAAQRSLDSQAAGEDRALLNDCMAGAWVQTNVEVGLTLPQPRHPDRNTSISPGDLDETVRTMILVGDSTADENDVGTPFEKVAAFRDGLLGGLDACLARL